MIRNIATKGFYEHGNELLDHLSNYQLLKYFNLNFELNLLTG